MLSPRYCFFTLILLLTLTASSKAVVLSLRQYGTEVSDFQVDLDQPFIVDLHVDPKGESVVGLSIFLTYPDADLQLVDIDPTTPNVVEGVQPTELLQSWLVLDNDTHGDPGNDIDQGQVDYVQLLIFGDAEKAIINPSVVAQLKFRPRQATKQTRLRFDEDEGRSRLTEATVLTKDRAQKQIKAILNNAVFSIKGGPVLSPIPDIHLLQNETSEPIYLDNYVEESNTQPQQLKWLDIANPQIAANIDPITHKATFKAKGDFFGSTSIRLQVTDSRQHTVIAEIKVRVMTAPVIKPLPAKRLRLNRSEIVDLSQYVSDADAPDLNGLTWDWSAVQSETSTLDTDGLATPVQVRINASLATLEGKRETGKTAVQFVARDSDGNQTSAAMNLTVLPDIDGPIASKIPLLVFTVDGTQILPSGSPFNLDDYVIDAIAEDDQISWQVEGNKQVKVEGLESRRPIFRGDQGGIKEDFLIVAQNHLGQYSEKKSILVEIVPVGAPPQINDDQLFADLLNQDEVLVILFDPDKTLPLEKRSVQVDLKKYVRDYDSNPEEIQWSVADNDQIQFIIDQGIATISAKAVATEKVTLTATDPKNYTDEVEIPIQALKVTEPQIRKLPQTIKLKAGETWSDLQLDQYVTDDFTPADQIKWFSITPDPKLVSTKILPDRRLELKVMSDWAGELTLTLTATNQLGKTARQSVKVRVTATPEVSLPKVVEVRENWQQRLELDQYVKDTDSKFSDLQWVVTPDSSPVAILDLRERILIIKGATGKVGQTFPLQIKVTDGEGNPAEVALQVKVVEAPKLPPTLVKNFPTQRSFINDETKELDLTNQIIDSLTKKPMETSVMQDNLTLTLELEKKDSPIQIKREPAGSLKFVFSTPKVPDDFKTEVFEKTTLWLEDPNGLKLTHDIQVLVSPSKPILKDAKFEEPILLYSNIDKLLDLQTYVEQRSGITWEIENEKELIEGGLKIERGQKDPALLTLKFEVPAGRELNLVDKAQAEDESYLKDHQCPNDKQCFGFQLKLKANRNKKFSQAELPVLIIKPPLLKLNIDLSITFSSEEAKDLKEGIEQELSTLIDYEDISKLYWQFGSVKGLDLLVWDPTTKKWQKPDGKKPISIDKNKPFIKLIPDKTFATDFKEGKLKITVSDMWDTEDKGEIPIRIVQPPKFQDFPKVINIRCGQADYQSTFSTAYLDLYSYVTLDSSIKTDKARLEWSWEIWEASTGKYRKPVDTDRFKVAFRPTAKQVQLTEKLVTITVASNFFSANNETTFVDQKVRFSAKDPTTEESGTVDVTLRIWKPNSKAEVPILQGLKDRDIYPGQELALNFTVFDLDSSAEELVWNNSIPEALSVIMEKETPVAGIQKGRLKIKVAESFEQARDTFQIDITIKDPDCNLLEQPLKISIIDPPDKTPPKIEVFAVVHPLLPRMIFIAITANEKLKGAPTVTVGRQRLSGLKAEPEQLIWHQTHFLSSDGEGTITILAKGTDLSKNTGSGEATLKTAVGSPAAPTKPATTKLHLNFPNPFNPETWIPYQLAQDTNVSFRIYNEAGELVRQLDKGFQPGGFYLSQNQAFYWDGKTAKGETVASGTYFYQIQAGDYTETRKMTILK